MATPLGIKFSTAENQVLQCDEQTFGSIYEFKKAGVARAPLAKTLKQVSVETDEALCEPATVLWRTRKQAHNARVRIFSLLPSKTLSFTSTKENSKNSSLGVV